MRVLAVGVGGAGSRIVDALYGHDRRSGVHCMDAVAIDLDSETMLDLQYLPAPARLYYPPLHIGEPDELSHVVNLEEVMSRIRRTDILEIDAILICCGLGGTLVDLIPMIIPEIRKAFIEPIFAVAVLPCRKEGEKRSAKAADDLDMLFRCTDAVILFDNETQTLRFEKEATAATEKNKTTDVLSISRILPATRQRNDRFDRYNEHISRRISLLLRAGEFSNEGLEVGEVVLDAGEMLNTLKGMGLVAVGYASEELPFSFYDIFGRFRSLGYFVESSQKKASRIVSLAKKAVYDEMSIPCDMTSAEKALVLIAGPSHELSMRGFQTIRSWIDRSIAGLEMRSGDYPVRNTRFVGIIVVLSGLTNIPRVEEIRQIRTQSQREAIGRAADSVQSSDHAAQDTTSTFTVLTRPPEVATDISSLDTHHQMNNTVGGFVGSSEAPMNQGAEQSSVSEIRPVPDNSAAEDDSAEQALDNDETSSDVRRRRSAKTGSSPKISRKRRPDEESEDGIIWFR